MNPTRREVLAAFLGLPAALAACRRGRRGNYGGQIVGANVRVGHSLRVAATAGASLGPMRTERARVVIVGAGPSGLAAAWRLTRAGFDDYVILDLEDAPGGTSRSGRNRVSAYPWGAHYVPLPTADQPAFVTLLREMDIVTGTDADGEPVAREESLVRDLDERLFHAGRWHEGLYLRDGASTQDLREMQSFRDEVSRWVARRDARGRRMFALPMVHGSDDDAVRRLDTISMGAWMRERGFQSSRLHWWVDYACRDDYGLQAADTSAWAGLFYFASRVRRAGEAAQELIAWPEGNGRLVRHLAEAATPARLRTGLLTTDIRVVPGGAEVTALAAETRSRTDWRAEQVIAAIPKFVARRVVEAWREHPPAGIDAFTYSPWMVANVTLRGRPRSEGVGMAWDNVFYDSPSLGYVCATHQSMLDHGPTVLTYYYPLTGHDPNAERRRLLAASWTDWADIVVTDLARAHPGIESLIENIDVYRWGHAMVRPVPGFAWSGARERAAEPVADRIFFAHSDLSGLALFEEAFHRGIVAAEGVLRARGLSFESYA